MPRRTPFRAAGPAARSEPGSVPRSTDAAQEEPPRASPLIVLGIDPGTRVVGYGALVLGGRHPRLLAAGVIRAPARESVPSRLGAIRAELDRLLERLRPGVVVVEEAFAARNAQSALRLGEGRGVVLASAALSGADVHQLPPAVAKKVVVGHGGAHKDQVARMVAHALDLRELTVPRDATDALALALAYLGRRPTAALGG